MLIYPAIDLKDGVCVRLMHGRFDQVTRYDDQPAMRLSAFAAEGAEWIHIVDLDGAEAGEAMQHALIGELTQAIDVRIQSGGGVRSANDVAKLLDSGVSRVVVGSLAVTLTAPRLMKIQPSSPMKRTPFGYVLRTLTSMLLGYL